MRCPNIAGCGIIRTSVKSVFRRHVLDLDVNKAENTNMTSSFVVVVQMHDNSYCPYLVRVYLVVILVVIVIVVV